MSPFFVRWHKLFYFHLRTNHAPFESFMLMFVFLYRCLVTKTSWLVTKLHTIRPTPNNVYVSFIGFWLPKPLGRLPSFLRHSQIQTHSEQCCSRIQRSRLHSSRCCVSNFEFITNFLVEWEMGKVGI